MIYESVTNQKVDDLGAYFELPVQTRYYGTIGDQTEIYWSATDEDCEGILGYEPVIKINCAFFQENTTNNFNNIEPNYGYQYQILNSMPQGEWIPMEGFGTGWQQILNAQIWIYRKDNKIFFKMKFHTHFDWKGFWNNGIPDNKNKYLKRSFNDMNLLQGEQTPAISAYDQYSHHAAFTIYHYWGYNDGVSNLFLADYLQYYYDLNLKFWNPVLDEKYWDLPTWSFEVQGVATSNQLAIYENTTVKFTLPDFLQAGDYADKKVIFGFINVSNTNNACDFQTNYELCYVRAVNHAGTGTLDKSLCKPSRSLYNLSGDIYQAEITIDKSYLVANKKYRMFAIVVISDTGYGSDTEQYSYLSEELTCDWVDGIACKMNVAATVSDYVFTYLGNNPQYLAPAQRIKSEIIIDYSNDLLIDLAQENLGITLTSNDLRELVSYAVMTLKSYDGSNPDNNYDVFERRIFQKTTGVNFNLPTGGTMDYFGSGYDKGLKFECEFRLRHESNLPCLESYANGLLLPAPTGTMDMTNRQCRVSWNIVLVYPAPCILTQETLKLNQTIVVKPFQNASVMPIYMLGDDYAQTRIDPEDIAQYCASGSICCETDVIVTAAIQANLALSHTIKHLFGVLKPAYSVAQQYEYDDFVSTGDITQKTDPEILSSDEDFAYNAVPCPGDPNNYYCPPVAGDCINSNLPVGQYKVISWAFFEDYFGAGSPITDVTITADVNSFTVDVVGMSGGLWRMFIYSMDNTFVQNSYGQFVTESGTSSTFDLADFVESNSDPEFKAYTMKIFIEHTLGLKKYEINFVKSFTIVL